MRTSLLVIGAISCGATGAQPVLENVNLQLLGSAFDLYIVVDPGDSDPGPNGANVTWDFTGAIVDLAGGALFVPPASTPYGASYPSADLATLLVVGLDTMYSYYDVQASTLNRLAENVGSTDEVIYSDPSTLLQFPFTYPDSFVDDYVVDGTSYSVTRTCTGYGTVDFPAFGIFDNVLKVTASDGEISFFKSDPVEPLMSIRADGTTIVWERIPIGMEEHRNGRTLTLVPNPVSSFFRVQGLNSSATYRVLDAQGGLILTGRLSGAQDPIDVSELPPGMYVVQVTDARSRKSAILMKE